MPDGDPAWPEKYRDGNGRLELTDEVRDAIDIKPVPEAAGPFDPEYWHDNLVVHHPTGISEEYTTAPMAKGMNPNDLRDVARRQLVRDHPEILTFHDPGLEVPRASR